MMRYTEDGPRTADKHANQENRERLPTNNFNADSSRRVDHFYQINLR